MKNISIGFISFALCSSAAFSQVQTPLITSIFEYLGASSNQCDAFLAPGVNKITLDQSQTHLILKLASLPLDSSNIATVSATLISQNSCVDAAAQKSGRTLDEVSSQVLKQIAAMPAGELEQFTDDEKNQFVNYVINVLLFSESDS